MAPLDFLAAVLPSSGFYCVAELSSNKKEHRYVTTVQELEEIANEFDAMHKDAYFALASFSEAGERKADKALYLRSCFFDIDCGEGKDYPTKKQALAALVEFLGSTDLGGGSLSCSCAYPVHAAHGRGRQLLRGQWQNYGSWQGA